MAILEVKDLGINFGGLRAVDEFNLEIKAHQLAGLIGPNGAGKTTVFNMLSGVYTPTEGEIDYWDRNGHVQKIGKKTPAVLNNIGISRTFQNIRLYKIFQPARCMHGNDSWLMAQDSWLKAAPHPPLHPSPTQAAAPGPGLCPSPSHEP